MYACTELYILHSKYANKTDYYDRGITSLDGARDKKQIRRPPGRTGAPMVEVWHPYGKI